LRVSRAKIGAWPAGCGQRLLVFALLLAFLMPWGLQLLAGARTSDADLPACCRRNGMHHCMMSPAEKQAMFRAMISNERTFRAPMQRCPFWPSHLTLVFPGTIPATEPTPELSLTPPSARERSPQQAESMRRATELRTRHTRGPPALPFSA
jgi:hypothetical protein